MTWVIVWGSKIVANLVSECQLRNFGRHAAIVIDKSNDARVEAPLSGARISSHVLRVRLVAFTDAA